MNWKNAMNVLCVRLDAMGDVLMTTPAMKSLKDSAPGRKLTLLTSKQGAAIAESIPLFQEVITYEAPWLKGSRERKDSTVDIEMVKLLKEKNFDAVIIFTVYSQSSLPSALLCFLADIPLRAAYCRENPYGLLTDWIKETEPEKTVRHEVRRHLDLVQELGIKAVNLPLFLKMDEEASHTLYEKLSQYNVTDKKRIIIHPGSTAASRRYSESGFAEVADALSDLGHTIIFTGSREERTIIDNIQSQMINESINLGGELTLKEMIALLGSSPLLISNNSGPVHMAAGLGTPVVVLYALTNPQHTPWLVPHHVLFHDVDCKYCYKSICPNGTNSCLYNIKPEMVVRKSLELLIKEEAPSYDFLAINPLPYNERVNV